MSERRGIAAICGMNNIGKSTVINGVARIIGAEVLKFPIYNTPTGRRINAYLREGNPENLSPLDAQRIFAQNRFDFEPELLAMAKNNFVILEDYNGTGKAWGMIAGIELRMLEKINKGQLEPDITVLLDGERFNSGIESNHKHESIGSDGWNRGRQIYLDLAKRYGWRVVGVKYGELEREINEVTEIIRRVVK